MGLVTSSCLSGDKGFEDRLMYANLCIKPKDMSGFAFVPKRQDYHLNASLAAVKWRVLYTVLILLSSEQWY
jgi:hypothetical protein